MPQNPRRCLLFVPGSRPERFEKALASDADQVCIDLEDAVPLAEKMSARKAALDFMVSMKTARSEVGIRINPVGSAEGLADLDAIARAKVLPAFVMIAKVETADDIKFAAGKLGALPLIALLESPAAVFESRAIAAASQSLQALMFGGYDYAVAARVTARGAGWQWPRSMLSAAAAAAGVGAMDVPSLETHDMTLVEQESAEVIALGFTGRAAIHPAQVAVIQNAFLPSANEFDRAERIVNASNSANGAAIALDGKLVDLPIELAARRILELAQFGLRNNTAEK